MTTITNNVTEASDGSPRLADDPLFERVVESRAYDNNGSRLTVTDSLGRVTVSQSDVCGRPVSVSLKSGLTQGSHYDDVANTVTTGVTANPETGLASAERTETRYMDDAERETRVTGWRRDGLPVSESRRTFDGLGRGTESTAGDIASQVVFNSDGTPRTTTMMPMNQSEFPGQSVTAERRHDMMGVSTNKTLVSGDGVRSHGESRVLDARGRSVSQLDQMGRMTSFLHTPDGLVAESREEASGTVTRNSYDSNTRALVESTTTRPGAESVRRHFEYDPVTGAMAAVYYAEACPATRIVFEYDAVGNQTTTRYPDGKTISHVFDVHGRKTASTDVLGNTTRYEYNVWGLLTRAQQMNVAGDVMGDLNYAHDRFGRITRVTRGNGVTTTYAFASANEITSEHTTNAHGETIFEGEYTYDTHGNVVQKAISQKHVDVSDLVAEATTYRYNVLALSPNTSITTKQILITTRHPSRSIGMVRC